jgi:hypothetical protein
MSTVRKDQNMNQKTLTCMALAAFAATLVWAPWQFTVTQNADIVYSRQEFAPLWDAPRPPNDLAGTWEIRMSVLSVEWIAIGVFYLGLSSIYAKKLDKGCG